MLAKYIVAKGIITTPNAVTVLQNKHVALCSSILLTLSPFSLSYARLVGYLSRD
jgi:hypothetical protein